MSYPKPKPKSSVKSAFGVVRDFIGGHQEDDDMQLPSEASADPPDELGSQMQNSSEAASENKTAETTTTSVEPKPIEQSERGNDQPQAKTKAAPRDFDHLTQELRAGKSVEARAEAARSLAAEAGQRATPHLIAALFDPDASVRGVANELLAELGNSSLSNEALAEAPPKPSAPKHPVSQKQTAPAAAKSSPGPKKTADTAVTSAAPAAEAIT
ncbi:MAG TPA: HEAT repeat domain-containing protein, partial [Pyrinomonadaceae bacterium]|nr:HEAT repeat domain-containing protein [Pyrinomonadaceae bacterium]